MKLLKKINLQWRITILTALVLLVSSILLTTFSLLSANKMLLSTVVTTDTEYSDYYDSEEYIKQNQDSSDTETNINSDTDSDEYGNYVLAAEAKANFDIKGVVFCAITVIIGTTAIYFISGQALKPLKKLTTQVSEIDENNLSA